MEEGRNTTVLDDLPESFVFEEILVRLPAKDVLRCRVVRKSWRHGTSTNDFLLAHYHHQPSLPIVKIFRRTNKGYDFIFSVLNDSSATSINGKLCIRTVLQCSDLRYEKERPHVHASCDGLFLMSISEIKGLFIVCNPTTRQHAHLPPLLQHSVPTGSIQIFAFYQHHPSREYRILYSIHTKNEDILNLNVDFYVLTVGSVEPRPIEKLPVSKDLLDGLICCCTAPVQHRGCLHWELGQHFDYPSRNTMVFDTMLETFRWMPCPCHLYRWMSLYEMNGSLAMICSHGCVTINIYVMEDYATEIWALAHQINIIKFVGLPPLDYRKISILKIVPLNERELLIKLMGGYVLHCDIDGKFLGNIACDDFEGNVMDITTYRFRENIIRLPFFDKQDHSGTP